MSYMGISDYSSILTNYRTPQIPSYKGNVDSVQKANQVDDLPVKENAEPVKEEKSLGTASVKIKNIDVNDVSLKFNAKDDFSYLGRDVDIENLDMQKAVSDMQKDGILKQYQYFVNSSNLF